MSKNSDFNKASRSGSTKGPSGGKVHSPSNTPAENLATIGGMPPIKKIDQIDKENTPKSAPNAVHGI